MRNSPLMRAAADLGRAGQRLLVDGLRVRWKIGNIPLSKFPRFGAPSFGNRGAGRFAARGKIIGRILYFTGCATQLFYQDVGRSVVDVLTALGFEVVVPDGLVCCGAPMFLTGFGRESLPNVLKNLAILDDSGADAIVVDCATCGGALKKEIPSLLEELGQDVDRAVRVAAKVKDVTELVSERLEFLQPAMGAADSLTVTYHDPCHLIRGMGVKDEPRKILKFLPHVKFVEMENAAECCGGAGSYQFENVDLSERITAKKSEAILASGANLVATGCPGCRLTLAGNLPDCSNVRALHTIQVVAGSLRPKE